MILKRHIETANDMAFGYLSQIVTASQICRAVFLNKSYCQVSILQFPCLIAELVYAEVCIGDIRVVVVVIYNGIFYLHEGYFT